MGTLVCALVATAPALDAQERAVLRTISGVAEDRARLNELLAPAPWSAMLRSGAEVRGAGARGVHWLLPEAHVVFNSGLITTMSDGALWSGRGTNGLVRGGVTASRGRVRLTLAPELTWSENRAVEVPTVNQTSRSTWSDPWRTAGAPLDRPLRFGTEPLMTLGPGQSELTVEVGRSVVGIGSGNLWWGPGLRNALVLSDNAAGIPRLFARLPQDVTTPLGAFRGEWFVGALTESIYFDAEASNDLRAASGLAVTLAPRGVTGLTVGAARLIVAPVDGAGGLAARAFDPLLTMNGGGARDQMTSIFGRWMVPGTGIELWSEYGWQRLPASAREWLVAPNADGAWTTGAQWAIPRKNGAWRMQVEFSDLAQSRVDTAHAARDYYTGRAAVQGFTQRGQLLGAGVGPGATSGWLAVDRVRNGWSLGGVFSRVRWENDAFYRQRLANQFGHDVSLFTGMRGAWTRALVTAEATLLFEHRVNYLFESGRLQPLLRGQRDENNVRLELRFSPR
jgi:hypothetical protein